MTKEITKAVILQEIQDKFKLREFDPANFLFDETVVPIYNIEPHLSKYEIKHKTQSITSTGAMNFFIVPKTEKWTLRAYEVFFLTGNYSSTGVYVGDRPDASDYIYLDLLAGVSVSYLNTLRFPIVLTSGNSIYANIDGYVATGNMRLDIDVRVEEIR